MSLKGSLFMGLVTLLLCPALAPAQEPEAKKSTAKLDRYGDPLPAGAVARLGSTRFRHTGAVHFVAYGADGRMLVTSGSDGHVRIWDARSGKELHRFQLKAGQRRYPGASGAPLLSGDGTTLVLQHESNDCTVVDVASGKVLREFKLVAGDRPGGFPGRGRFFGEFGDTRQHLSRDGRLLVVRDGGISLWDTTTGKHVRRFGDAKEKEAFLTSATLSPDGKTLVAIERRAEAKRGELSARLRFFDAGTGQHIRSVDCAQDVADVVLLADGKSLLATDQRQRVLLLDAETGKEVRQFTGKGPGVTGMVLAPDEKTLFVAGLAEIVQHELATGKELGEFPLPGFDADDRFGRFGRGGRHVPLAVSPDGKTLALPAQGAVVFWDVAARKEIQVIEGHRGRIESIAFAAASKQVLTASADNALCLWDPATSKRLEQFVPKLAGPDRPGRGMEIRLARVQGAFFPDGKSVAGLWWGDKVHVWDAATGKLQRQFGGSGQTAFAFAPDGKHLALAAMDGVVRMWDIAADREVRTFGQATRPRPDPDERVDRFDGDYGEQAVFAMTFSPDQRMLVSTSLDLLRDGLKVEDRFWELASGQERMRFESTFEAGDLGPEELDTISSALDCITVAFVFAPDGRSLVEAGFSSIRLRDLRTGKEVRAFGGRRVAAATVRFSPDGKTLVAGTHDGGIRLWDLASGTILMDFPAHKAPVTALAFSADGTWLASGARDAEVLLWDWDHIRRQATLRKSAAAAAEQLWADLAGKDAFKAHDAIVTLAAAPAEAIPFLKTRLQPVPPVEAREIEKLLDQLDDAQYPVRRKAEQALEKLGDIAGPAIQARLKRDPTPEVARRLEGLKKKLDAQVLTSDVLQVLRAIEALEMMGTAEAHKMVQELAKGAGGHRITEAARLAVQRMNKSPGGP